jgi:hypothetical protein
MRAWIVAAVLVAWTGVANARDGIVLESYTGPRPADASKLLAPLLEELQKREFEAGDSIGRLYEGKVSRPRTNSLPADFAKQLLAGQQAYLRGDYAGAVQDLQKLIDLAHDNSGAFAKNQALRQTMLDGLVALALAQDRNGDPKSAELTFGELARSFPGAQVPANRWGANAAKMFAQVARDVQAQPVGRLIVKAPSTAEVYINERFEQNGNVVKGSMVPGEYRIFARDGAMQSRLYRVTVNSSVDASVTIDLDLDSAVHTSSEWTGLQYTGSDRERFEQKHAAAFANAIEERAVVVVGIDATQGVIFGALVSLSGKDERRASIPLSAGDNSKKQLARFLAGDPATSDIVVLVAPGAPGNTAPSGGVLLPPPTSHEHNKARWGGWPILTGIATLGAAGAAVYFFKVDGDCTDGSHDAHCAYNYERTPHAFVSVGAGAVLAGITIYLIVTHPKADARTAFVVPTRGGAVAGLSIGF